MPATEAQITAAAAWLEAHAAAAEQIEQAAAQAAKATWLGFEGWYSAAAVAAVAQQMAQQSLAGQDVMIGAAQQYVAGVVAIVQNTPITIPRSTVRPVRNGAPLDRVHSRPAKVYKRAIAVGKTHEEAVALALGRAAQLQVTDLSLAERMAQQNLMRDVGITTFRRVVRPELSETGSCGLCIAASDRIYTTAVLMPMHDRCKCKTMPIVGDVDPGNSLNNLDLNRLYGDAGSTSAKDLKQTRYQVNEHGEYGPSLRRQGDAFRGPAQVPLENDPERAARMLAQTLPVLERMESGNTAAGPLQYQRDLVARLTSIVAA